MNDFESQFKRLEAEITDLKTNARRNGNYLRTVQKEISFETSLDADSGIIYYTRAILTPVGENPLLYCGAILPIDATRQPDEITGWASTDQGMPYMYELVARDWWVFHPHQEPYSFTVKAVITATDEFTFTTERVYL